MFQFFIKSLKFFCCCDRNVFFLLLQFKMESTSMLQRKKVFKMDFWFKLFLRVDACGPQGRTVNLPKNQGHSFLNLKLSKPNLNTNLSLITTISQPKLSKITLTNLTLPDRYRPKKTKKWIIFRTMDYSVSWTRAVL